MIDNARFSWNHHESIVWQEWVKLFKFGAVGLSGIIVNEGVLIYLKGYVQFSLPVASIIAIELSILSNFILNDTWTFKTKEQHALSHWWQRLLSCQVVSVGGVAINFIILNALAAYRRYRLSGGQHPWDSCCLCMEFLGEPAGDVEKIRIGLFPELIGKNSELFF